MEEQLFTRKQVAKMFGVCPRTLIRWAKKGLLKPKLYVNTRARYHIDDIEKVYSHTQTRVFNKKPPIKTD